MHMKLCLVGDVLDVMTGAKFQNEILRGYGFIVVLLILEWALQQWSATALPVISALDESASALATYTIRPHTNCATTYTPFWASGGDLWGAKSPKMRDSLPRTPMNRCTKFDAASLRFVSCLMISLVIGGGNVLGGVLPKWYLPF